MPADRINPLNKLSLIFSVAVPVVALVSSLSVLIYKVDAIATTTDKTLITSGETRDRVLVIETTLSIQEPTKRQGASR